jgi:hypothetical protein
MGGWSEKSVAIIEIRIKNISGLIIPEKLFLTDGNFGKRDLPNSCFRRNDNIIMAN